MARLALFAYGSLVSAESAAHTLGRPVEPVAIVRLAGWRRCWSVVRDNLASEKTFARRSDGELLGDVLGLNLEPGGDDAGAPNGVLIELSEAELQRLDARELRHERVVVSAGLDDRGGFDEVFAYRAKPRHHAPRPPAGAVVISSYAAFVESAFDALGAGQRDLYLETTSRLPVEVVDAVLVEDRIPPGNPRDW